MAAAFPAVQSRRLAGFICVHLWLNCPLVARLPKRPAEVRPAQEFAPFQFASIRVISEWPSDMKRRWKILIGLGIFFLLLSANLFITMHVHPVDELEAYKKLLWEKGEKLEWSKVIPPAATQESNSAAAVEAAMAMFDSNPEEVPYAMQMVAPGRALIGWQQPDARGDEFTNSWEQYAAKVEADRPAVDLLHGVLARPKLEFPLDETDLLDSLFKHLAPMKRAARKLAADTIFDLHNGRPGPATTNIVTILALAQKNGSQGLEICNLVRLAIIIAAAAPTWEFLEATNISDVQLARIQNGWEQLDLLKDGENAFEWERAWALREAQRSRSSHQGFTNLFGPLMGLSSSGSSPGGGPSWSGMLDSSTRGMRRAIGEAMWRSSWSFSDELQTLKANQLAINTLRAMQTNRSQFYKRDYDAMATRMRSLVRTNGDDRILRVLQIDDWRGILGSAPDISVRKMIETETARRIVIVAIGLKRFQLKRGEWPATLDQLVPEFIPSVPIDPFDGHPLNYRRNADATFLLYSVGEDGVDDGGDPTNPASSSLFWQNVKARDWVWPQPATPAEVQYFNDNPPKR
jgi:hypothetical protein